MTAETGFNGRLGRILERRDERRIDAPVRRMVAAKLIAKALAQIVLRVAVPALALTAIRLHANRRAPRLPFVGFRDEPLLRIRASTTWLRAIAPSRFDHGDSVAGARASPAISALSARLRSFADFPNTRRDVASTP